MIRSLLLLAMIVLTGCAATGPAFHPEKKIPDGYGIVYIYRIDKLANRLIQPGIKVDDTEYPTLPAGGYLPIVVKEGEHVFDLILSKNYEDPVAIKVSVKENTESFFKLITYNNEKRVFKIVPVTSELAMSEIGKCKLIDFKYGKRYSKSFFIDN